MGSKINGALQAAEKLAPAVIRERFERARL
jgi:hypothetical protein